MITLKIISGEGSFELGPCVQEINRLFHRNVAPVAHFQHSLHVGDGKEGPTGLEMHLQRVLRESSDIVIRSVGDSGVSMGGWFKSGVAFNVGRGEGNCGSLGRDGVSGGYPVAAFIDNQLLFPLLNAGGVCSKNTSQHNLNFNLMENDQAKLSNERITVSVNTSNYVLKNI